MRENPKLVWEMYQSLEYEFLSYSKYVPLTEPPFDIWSFPLGNLLNNIGSCVDSFCKNAIFCESLNDVAGIDQLRQKRKHTMEDYRLIFKEDKFKIQNRQIFDLVNFSSIRPFEAWSTNNTPDWWTRYTDIKHDRFRNKERATFKATLDALGGLFVLFLILGETRELLIDHKIIISDLGLSKNGIKELLSNGEPYTDSRPNGRLFIKTSLFGYVFEDKMWPPNDIEKKNLLSPSYPSY